MISHGSVFHPHLSMMTDVNALKVVLVIVVGLLTRYQINQYVLNYELFKINTNNNSTTYVPLSPAKRWLERLGQTKSNAAFGGNYVGMRGRWAYLRTF